MVNQQILKFIKDHQTYFDSEIQLIKKIENGFSNDIYCLQTTSKKYYARLAKRNSLINRADEKTVFDALGISYYTYANNGNYLRDWYSADNINKWNRKMINMLIKQVNEIHGIGIIGIKKFNPLEYDAAFKKSVFYKTYGELYYSLVKKYENYRITTCHNDLNNNNILYVRNKLYILDFERAQLNSEYWDWANFAREKMSLKQIRYICDKCNLDLAVFKDFLIMTCIHALQWTVTVTETFQIIEYRTEILQQLKLFWTRL